jgi:thioester reductase-like protein
VLAGARVLLTGATGRLGRCIAEDLLATGCDLVLVVRAATPEAAKDRVLQAVRVSESSRQLSVVCGDVTKPWLGLDARERRRLRHSVDVILHAAATTSFSLPLAEARATNLEATRNVLAFAERSSRLWRLAHVSTAFVAGRRTGRVLESDLEHDAGFLNTYQQSKHEAERLVEGRRDSLPVVVFRPSVVLDGPGSIQRRSAFRFAYELVRRGLMPALPGSSATPVDLVTEGDAARAITQLLFAPDADGTYHVTNGDLAPTLGEIVDEFGVRYLEEEQFAWELSKWRHERPRLAPVYDELGSFIYELGYPKTFDTSRCEEALGRPVRIEDPLAALVGGEEQAARPVEVGAQQA